MNGKSFSDTAKNVQLVALLMKTGLNNVLLLGLFTVVKNVVQHFYFRFRKNSIKRLLTDCKVCTVKYIVINKIQLENTRCHRFILVY